MRLPDDQFTSWKPKNATLDDGEAEASWLARFATPSLSYVRVCIYIFGLPGRRPRVGSQSQAQQATYYTSTPFRSWASQHMHVMDQLLASGAVAWPAPKAKPALQAGAGSPCRPGLQLQRAQRNDDHRISRACAQLPPARLPAALIGSPAGARARREQLKAGRLQDHPDELVRSRRFGPILLRQPRACTHRPMMSMGRPIDARARERERETKGSGGVPLA